VHTLLGQLSSEIKMKVPILRLDYEVAIEYGRRRRWGAWPWPLAE